MWFKGWLRKPSNPCLERTVRQVLLLGDVELAGAEVGHAAQIDLAVHVVCKLPVAHLGMG